MNKQLLVSIFIAAVAIFSCQKYQNDLASSDLASSLTGAVSEIEATQIYEWGIVDIQSLSKTITSPLLVDKSCGYIKSGTEELNRNGNVVVIDYGDGTCDDSATVTANDTTEVIDLHKGQFDKEGRFHGLSHGFGRH